MERGVKLMERMRGEQNERGGEEEATDEKERSK